MFEVVVGARDLSPFIELVGTELVETVARRAEETRALLGSSVVWNVNSTAAGGGVAEMLRPILRYARGLGVNVRWAVIEGPPSFFTITKRLHNALHDNPGDGSPLGAEQTALYESVLEENARALLALLRPGDIVICHDPQTAGLIPHLARRGIAVLWRCHIGHEDRGWDVDLGWSFLRKYVEDAPLAVFSRGAYAPSWLPQKRAIVVPPSIDPFAVKNTWMPEVVVRAVLAAADVVEPTGPLHDAVFVRDDGTTANVTRRARVLRASPPPRWDMPLVVQVSRWDRMKDHGGVIAGFARLASDAPALRAELVLAGPSASSVADDPEGPEVIADLEREFRALPEAVRSRVHIAQLPMEDTEENAAIVNALQRHAAVVVQKSLREGFGLTVTEAMWKRRPVVASAIGGIIDQVRDGVEGLLLRDPTDPEETARALRRVLESPELAVHMGNAAYERVRENYLTIRSLLSWADLVKALVQPEAA